MTAAQMKYEFEVGYDRITNFDAPGYNEKEISARTSDFIYESTVSFP